MWKSVFLAVGVFACILGAAWGHPTVGASLALESTPVKWRGVLSGLLQEGYAAGNLLAAIAYRTLYPHLGWRWMFFVGGLLAFGIDHTQHWRGDLVIAPNALRGCSDTSILQNSAPAAGELDAEAFGKRL